MPHPARIVLAVLAVLAVVVVLKLFRLAPDDVFAPPEHGGGASVSTPFGSFHLGDEERAWFRPLLLIHILSVPALWRLCERLGYSGWFGLAMLVPLANVLLLYFLAFSDWPAGARAAGQKQPQEWVPPKAEA
jgi:hypothetical protein